MLTRRPLAFTVLMYLIVAAYLGHKRLTRRKSTSVACGQTARDA